VAALTALSGNGFEEENDRVLDQSEGRPRTAVHECTAAFVNTPELAVYRAAVATLVHGFSEEQRVNATRFLLDELERLYWSGNHSPPGWINQLRGEMRW